MPLSFARHELIASLVLEEQTRAERLLNAVRLLVLVLMTVAAMIYAPALTPALTRVNAFVLAPMLLWTLGQYLLFHGPRKTPGWLSTANVVIDVTAVTTLQMGYGIVGHPLLAINSPIFLAYFAILAARPITGSLEKAILAGVMAVLQYAFLISFFVLSGRIWLYHSPLEVQTLPGVTLLDEGARLFLLGVTGAIAVYATKWNERILWRALAEHVEHTTQERELTSRLQEADKLAGVGALAAATVHEVRNPLSVIAMRAELLRETELTPEQQEDVTQILEEAKRTSTFVNDLLRISRRAEAEEMDLVDMSEIVKRAVVSAYPLLRDQHISVEIHTGEKVSKVMGSLVQMERAILNLIFNAAQAMEHTSTAKKIVISLNGDARHTTLSIRDTGTGIPLDAMDQIFNRFFTTKPAGKGTGLGLWVVSQIVEAHGGTISAGNGSEGGAVFTINLPVSPNT